jgi:hypothetical protein
MVGAQQNCMISYDLVKQLKEAGFPQEFEYHGGYYCDQKGYRSPQVSNSVLGIEEDTAYAPTLSELIEAVGDLPLLLGRRAGGKWAAGILPNKEATFDYWIIDDAISPRGKLVWGADSPEQAVARLWLALNSKAV